MKTMPTTVERKTKSSRKASHLYFAAAKDESGWKIFGDFDDIDGQHIATWMKMITGRKALSDHRSLPDRRSVAFTSAVLNGTSSEPTRAPRQAITWPRDSLVRVPYPTLSATRNSRFCRLARETTAVRFAQDV